MGLPNTPVAEVQGWWDSELRILPGNRDLNLRQSINQFHCFHIITSIHFYFFTFCTFSKCIFKQGILFIFVFFCKVAPLLLRWWFCRSNTKSLKVDKSEKEKYHKHTYINSSKSDNHIYLNRKHKHWHFLWLTDLSANGKRSLAPLLPTSWMTVRWASPQRNKCSWYTTTRYITIATAQTEASFNNKNLKYVYEYLPGTNYQSR